MSSPISHLNWLRHIDKAEFQGSYETAVFTDARITGMVVDGYGPYQFLNTVPGDETPGVARPSVVLRVDLSVKYEIRDFTKTEEGGYHAGGLDDELAAVLSLCLGVRAQAGDRTREFGRGDARGLPCGIRFRPDPLLVPFRRRDITIPSAAGNHNLKRLEPFRDFFQLNPEGAAAVIRSARQYQQALWVAESDQNYTWMALSSAVETAANHWRAAEDTPVDRLRAWKPKLVERLTEVGGLAFMEEVAKEIAPLAGATKKFLDFMLTFCPDPPANRPPGHFQIDWTPKGLKRIYNKVYEYRSRGLHAGIPFPSPMGWGPIRSGEWVAEKSVGAAGTGLHSWSADDLPLQLHTFEHLVRHSLLKWWSSLPRRNKSA